MPLFVDGVETQLKELDATTRIDDWLDGYPTLKQNSITFREKPTRHLTVSDKVLFVAQREFATVRTYGTPVKHIGSDEATTCHILVLQDERCTGVSVGHLDGSSVALGIREMLDELLAIVDKQDAHNEDICIHAHIVGGFVDERGESKKLFRNIINNLCVLKPCVVLKNACVYNLNSTICQNSDFQKPIIFGIAVEISTMDIRSCTFEYRGPDEVMRNARNLSGLCRMISVYDDERSLFCLSPFNCKPFPGADILQNLSDSEVLLYMSTSPHCQPPHFATSVKDSIKFVLENEHNNLFPGEKPILYEMSECGRWLLKGS